MYSKEFIINFIFLIGTQKRHRNFGNIERQLLLQFHCYHYFREGDDQRMWHWTYPWCHIFSLNLDTFFHRVWSSTKEIVTSAQPSEGVKIHFKNISSSLEKNVVDFWLFVNSGWDFPSVKWGTVSWCHRQWAEDWLQNLLTCLWEMCP